MRGIGRAHWESRRIPACLEHPSTLVHTSQHLSTLVNACPQIPVIDGISMVKGMFWGGKRPVLKDENEDKEPQYCKHGDELCRNEPYSRRIRSFLHNLSRQYTKSCTQALYQNLRAELALVGNFDTIAVRVQNGCSRVHQGAICAGFSKCSKW